MQPNFVELGRTPQWILAQDTSNHLIKLQRTSEPWPGVPVADDVLAKALAPIHRPAYGLLLDLRDGPLRNDAEFETAGRNARTRAMAGFGRVAVLVKTAVGSLQLNRLLREDGAPVHVFREEAEAFAFLSHGSRTADRAR